MGADEVLETVTINTKNIRSPYKIRDEGLKIGVTYWMHVPFVVVSLLWWPKADFINMWQIVREEMLEFSCEAPHSSQNAIRNCNQPFTIRQRHQTTRIRYDLISSAFYGRMKRPSSAIHPLIHSCYISLLVSRYSCVYSDHLTADLTDHNLRWLLDAEIVLERKNASWKTCSWILWATLDVFSTHALASAIHTYLCNNNKCFSFLFRKMLGEKEKIQVQLFFFCL